MINKKSLLLILLFPILLYNSINSDAFTLSKKKNTVIVKKTPLPKTIIKKTTTKSLIKLVTAKINVIDRPTDEYQPGSPFEVIVNVKNIKAKVQYRCVMRSGDRVQELYYSLKGYYSPFVDSNKEHKMTMKNFKEFQEITPHQIPQPIIQ